MPWFKVDDGFYDHPKAIAAGSALTLWLRAGCWSAKQLTDGFIPAEILPFLGGTRRMAERLVNSRATPGGVGLWVKTDGGWAFHDWSDYQPTRADVEDRRAKRAAAGRIGGIRSGQSRGSKGEASASAVASHVFEPPARPGPTPLLTLAGRLTEVDARGLAAGLPAEVVAEWQAIAGPGVDLEDEARAYLARHGDTTPANPRAAWLGWLKAARRHHDQNAPREPSPGCPDPTCRGGWLPEADDGRAVPCPTCRPHLRPVPTHATEAS